MAGCIGSQSPGILISVLRKLTECKPNAFVTIYRWQLCVSLREENDCEKCKESPYKYAFYHLSSECYFHDLRAGNFFDATPFEPCGTRVTSRAFSLLAGSITSKPTRIVPGFGAS